jgi:Bacterial SH3 domain
MKRALAAAAATAFAAGLWGCASAPPPPPPAREPVPAETQEKPADTTSTGAVYLVAAKTANLRKAPAASSAALGRLKKGDRITFLEEKDDWLRVKLANEQIGWVRRDLVTKDDGCLPDRREVLLTPPMLHMSEAGAPGARGKVVVEAEIDDKGDVGAVRVVKNETGSPERAEMAKSEVQGVKFEPPVKRCRVTGFTYVYTRTF